MIISHLYSCYNVAMDKEKIKVRIDTVKALLNDDQWFRYIESEKKTSDMDDISGTEIRINGIAPFLNDEQKGLYYAIEAEALGHGGKKIVARLAKVSINSMTVWTKKLVASRISQKEGGFIIRGVQKTNKSEFRRKKRIGEGRKPISQEEKAALLDLVGKRSNGRSEDFPILSGISKSAREIKSLLEEKGISMSPTSILNILKDNGYSVHKVIKKRNLRSLYYQINNQPCMEDKISKINKDIRDNNAKKGLSLLLDYSGSIYEYSPLVLGTKSEEDAFYFIGTEDYNDNYSKKPFRISDRSNFLIKWWKEKGKEQFPEAEDIYLVIVQDDLLIVDTLLKRTCEAIHNNYGLKGALTYSWILRPKYSKWNCTLKRLYSVTHERPHDSITITLSQIVITE